MQFGSQPGWDLVLGPGAIRSQIQMHFFSFQAHTHAHLKAHPTHTSHTNTHSLHTHSHIHMHRPMQVFLVCICFQIDPSFLLLIVSAFSKFCCFEAYIPCGRWRVTGNRLHMPVSVISYTYTHSHTYYWPFFQNPAIPCVLNPFTPSLIFTSHLFLTPQSLVASLPSSFYSYPFVKSHTHCVLTRPVCFSFYFFFLLYLSVPPKVRDKSGI